MEDLNEIAIFTRVVDRKSFSAAAEELRLSPSVVSKRVTALEERLGVLLLNRSTRRLSLTEAGSQFHKKCARALLEISQASGEASGLANKLSGQIKVYSTLGAGLKHISGGIIEFNERYPQLSVDLEMGKKPVNLIEHGVDLLIRSADIKDSSIQSRVLLEVHHHIVASPAYFEKHGRPTVPSELTHHNCLLQGSRKNGNEWDFVDPNGQKKTVRVSGNFTTNSGQMLTWAALKGTGIALLPNYTADAHIASGELVPLFMDTLVQYKRYIRGFYPRTAYPQPKVLLLLDFLSDYAQKPQTYAA
jgi:DNA-binding transcriptional LysR family regulator